MFFFNHIGLFGSSFDQVDVVFSAFWIVLTFLAIIHAFVFQDMFVNVVFVEGFDDKNDQWCPVEFRMVMFFHLCN